MASAFPKNMTASIFCLVVVAATPALGEPLNIEGMGISRDIPCDGSDVGVYGAQNTIHFTGTCKTITIDGTSHTVSFDKTGQLTVACIEQKISGGEVGGITVDGSGTVLQATVKPAGDVAEVGIAGVKQQVSLTFAGPVAVNVQGFDHAIEWSKAPGAPEPKFGAIGVQTRIVRK